MNKIFYKLKKNDLKNYYIYIYIYIYLPIYSILRNNKVLWAYQSNWNPFKNRWFNSEIEYLNQN